MANLEKIEEDISKLKGLLVKYQDIFNEDGEISEEEDKKLKKIEAGIKEAEAKLIDVKDNTKKDSGKKWNQNEFDEFMEELNKELDEIEKKLGV